MDQQTKDSEALIDKSTQNILANTELSADQRAAIEKSAADKKAELEKEKADKELKIQADLDAKKKAMQKKEADITFAITAAQIIATTSQAIMKYLADPLLLPPADAILAGAAGATGIAQLASAEAQRDSVQSLGLGTLDTSGLIKGASHAMGGVSILKGQEIEGGEGIVSRKAMGMPGVFDAITNLNKSVKGGSSQNIRVKASGSLSSTGSNGGNSNESIKVHVLESDITKVQDKAKDIRKKANVF